MAQINPETLEVPPVRGWRWRKVRPCGTLAAWRRHQRRGEPMDPRCRAARNRFMRRLRAARRAAQLETGKSA